MSFDEMKSADIEARMKRLAVALKESRRRERLQNLKGDKRLADKVDDMQTFFYQGEYAKAREAAAAVWKGLNLESAISADSDWRKHLKDYRSTGSLIKMPKEWGFRRGGPEEPDRELELERGLSYVIGARPGVGKTTAGVNLAYYYAKRKAESGLKVLYLTNEMKPGQVWAKFRQVDLRHGNRSPIPKKQPFMFVKNWVRYPENFETEHRLICEMCQELSENLLMYSVRRMPIEDIGMVINDSANVFGKNPDIILLDYIQRVPRSRGFVDARLGTIHIAQSISEIALDMDAVFFVFSQMNKDGGFKESESPEEEAGVAWEISRPEDSEGALQPWVDWRIKKSRISAYFSTRVSYDDVSGTILDG